MKGGQSLSSPVLPAWDDDFTTPHSTKSALSSFQAGSWTQPPSTLSSEPWPLGGERP